MITPIAPASPMRSPRILPRERASIPMKIEIIRTIIGVMVDIIEPSTGDVLERANISIPLRITAMRIAPQMRAHISRFATLSYGSHMRGMNDRSAEIMSVAVRMARGSTYV